jgi:endoglucanase
VNGITRRAWLLAAASLTDFGRRAVASDREARSQARFDRGAIVRGPRDVKRLSLVFTGDQYAEGSRVILGTLRRRDIRSAWFLTGRFLRAPDHRAIINRARDDGHDLGPHSDQHLLYASWDSPPRLLVTSRRFLDDLRANDQALAAFVPDPARAFPYFLPPYEHHTTEIAEWTRQAGRTLINLTPGTRSHTDYMEDDDPRFVPAARIVSSVLDAERRDPDGLSGYLLLMHLGAGPGRTRDHLCDHLDALLQAIADRGYEFVGVGELLGRG